jgi:hypothetical protein
MKKGNISEVTNSKGSGRYKVPLTLAPQDWKMDSMGPFTEPVSHFISPSNAYDSYDGNMEMNKKTISKNEKMAKKARKIADQNFQQNDVAGNPINGFNPKGVTEPGTPDYIKKQANLPKKDYQEVLKEDLAVWFGTKKKPKGSKQPKGPWVNICRKDKNGKHPPCGRSEASDKAYPKCRAAGVAGKMSDSQKRAACQQKRKAEKKDPKIGTGNKPTMTSYKPKNESLKEIIKLRLNEFLFKKQNLN